MYAVVLQVWLTQIEKDLPRTFPGLKLMELSGRPALRRVLAAYSLHNSRVGYCQVRATGRGGGGRRTCMMRAWHG